MGVLAQCGAGPQRSGEVGATLVVDAGPDDVESVQRTDHLTGEDELWYSQAASGRSALHARPGEEFADFVEAAGIDDILTSEPALAGDAGSDAEEVESKPSTKEGAGVE